jgi:hypothetical protein
MLTSNQIRRLQTTERWLREIRDSEGFKDLNYYNYHPPQHQLQAYTAENLAKRLGLDLASLELEQSTQTPEDFERWSRSRDPSSIAWRRSDNGLYHPIK